METEKAELEVVLDQADKYIRSLEVDLASLCKDVVFLGKELDRVRRKAARTHFELRVLQEERASK